MKLVPHSLRWRLLLWYGLLLMAVLGAFGLTAHHLERTERLRSVDQDLQHRLSALVSALRVRRILSPPGEPPRQLMDFTAEVEALFSQDSGCYYTIWMREREPVASSTNAPPGIPRPESGLQSVRTRGPDLREAFLFAAPADCVLVGRSLAPEERSIRLHAALLAASGGLLLMLGLVGGSWLVTRAIRPVTDISHTAARIAEGDLTQRIPTTTQDSELGRLAGVLNSTFARLDDAFTRQARFTADAAHELRTPVTVILSETQGALTRDRPAAEYRESLETCQRAAQRMRRLVDQLLELARLDVPQALASRETCDLAALTAECIRLVDTLAAERGITIRPELNPAPCHGDPGQLLQVIMNLVTNAIHHHRNGGEVRITSATDAQAAAVLVVADNGPGIAAEDLPHVFERFYRADKARTSTAGRTGLGLSIAKAIIDAHHGVIEIESHPGDGATFTVRIPAGA